MKVSLKGNARRGKLKNKKNGGFRKMQKKIKIGVRLSSAARKDGKREGEACAWLDGKKAIYKEVFGGWVFEVEKVDFLRTINEARANGLEVLGYSEEK